MIHKRPNTLPKWAQVAGVALCLGWVSGVTAADPQQLIESLERQLIEGKGGVLELNPTTAVRWALIRNPDVLLGEEQIGVGRAQIESELAAWQPELFATLGYSESREQNTRTDRPVLRDDEASTEFGVRTLVESGAEVTLSYELIDRQTNLETSNDPDGFDDVVGTVQLEIRQPLMRGFKAPAIQGRIEQAKRQLTVAQLDLQRRLLETSYDTLSSYWQLHRAYQNQAIALEAMQNADALLADTRRLVEAGRLAPSAVFEAESGVLMRRAEWARAAQLARQWDSELRTLLAIDPSQAGTWSFRPTVMPDVNAVTAPDDLATYVEQVLSIWPNYQMANERIAIQEQALAMAVDESRASLDLVVAYGQNGRSLNDEWDEAFHHSVDGDYPEWRVGLEWSMALGGSQRGAAQEDIARSLVRQSKVEAAAIETEVANQLLNRLEQVESTLNEVLEHRKNQQLLSELLDRERAAFRRGETPVRVVIGREDAYNDARMRATEAEVRYELAKSALRLSDGTLLEQVGLSVNAPDSL